MAVVRIEGPGPQEPDDSDLEFNQRGFAIYGRVPTTYGEVVNVYESSSAEGPYIWLSLDSPDDDQTKHRTAHMSLEQAIEIRNNLDRAIERGARLYGIELEEE